jgi:hypothetical protein
MIGDRAILLEELCIKSYIKGKPLCDVCDISIFVCDYILLFFIIKLMFGWLHILKHLKGLQKPYKQDSFTNLRVYFHKCAHWFDIPTFMHAKLLVNLVDHFWLGGLEVPLNNFVMHATYGNWHQSCHVFPNYLFNLVS